MPNYLVVTVDDVTAQLAVVGPDDVGADPAGTASTTVAAHEGAVDPHPQYTTTAEAGAAAPVQSVAGKAGAVTLTPGDVGADPAGTASTTVAAHEGAVDPHPQYYDTARLSARRGLAGRYTATLGSGNNIQQIVDCGLGTVLAGVYGVPEVWISTDGGATFPTSVTLGSGTGVSSIVQLSSGTVLAGVFGVPEVWISTDGGATFPTSVTLGSGTGVSSIVQLSSGTVLAGVFGVPEVWISTDGGATFPSSATIGIGAAVMCIAQLPSGWVVAGGLGGTPIMASSDEGGTWTPLLDVIGGARIASLVGARSLLIGGFSSTHIHIVQEVLL